MQAKKLEKLVKNLENTFCQKAKQPSQPIIKKAQNLIKNGPKNLLTKQKTDENKSKISRPARLLKYDGGFLSSKNAKKYHTTNRDLSKSQDSHISSVTKNSNQNTSPTFSQTLRQTTPKEKKFGPLGNQETKKKITPTTNAKKSLITPTSKSKTPDKKTNNTPKNQNQLKKKSPKKTSKSNDKPKSSSTINKTFEKTLSRFEVFNQIKQKNLHDLRVKKHNEELSNASSCSFLSKNSSKILQKKEYKPPYKKTKEILDHKRQSISFIQQKMEHEKSIKNPQPSFRPQLITSTSNQKTVRNKNEFYKDMMQWSRKKKENNILKELELRNKEKEELTFHPEIDYNSANIANELYCEQAVEERLNKWKKNIDEKKKNLVENSSFNFTPQISPNTELLAERYYEKKKAKNEQENAEGEPSSEKNLDISPQRKNLSVSFNLDNNTFEEFERINENEQYQTNKENDGLQTPNTLNENEEFADKIDENEQISAKTGEFQRDSIL